MTPCESFLLAKNGSSKLKQLVLITFLLPEYTYIHIYIHIFVVYEHIAGVFCSIWTPLIDFRSRLMTYVFLKFHFTYSVFRIYIYIYIYMYIYLYIYVYIYMYIYIHINIYTSCRYKCMHLYRCTYIDANIKYIRYIYIIYVIYI